MSVKRVTQTLLVASDRKVQRRGPLDAEIVVVCDPPSLETYKTGMCLSEGALRMFSRFMEGVGVDMASVSFVTCSPPMPSSVSGSAKREGEFLAGYREQFKKRLARFEQCRLLIYLGAHAGRQVMGHPVKIMKARGSVSRQKDLGRMVVLPMLSPSHVMRVPNLLEQFKTDFAMVARLRKHRYSIKAAELSLGKVKYEWVNGAELRRQLVGQLAFSLDTETTGGWWHQGAIPIIVQITYKRGHSMVMPVYAGYNCTAEEAEANKAVLKEVIESRDYYFTGHNTKYDFHCLENIGIKVPLDMWFHDSMQLAFNVDENLLSKDLANCTKIWEPAMGGYSDHFDSTVDKSKMLEVKPEDILAYAGGDSDAAYRLTATLSGMVEDDERQWECYRRVQMPALRMFFKVEKRGIRIDKDELRSLGEEIDKQERRLYKTLIRQVPGPIKVDHLEKGKGSKTWRKYPDRKGLTFTRPDFVRDVLFTHRAGLRLKPVVFTKGTRNLKDGEGDKIPSTSKKDHLPYFDDNPFVAELIKYQTIQKIQSTFIGEEKVADDDEENSGIWKYIAQDDHIRPSYLLHRTVTGRTASAAPNGQNFPKRGDLAKAYRKIFVPRKGYVFGECDLSQAELRVAAWMAMEPNMIRLYKEGADIHTATAAACMGMSMARFMQLPEDERKQWRQRAKAVNFGFLYGMGWRKFMGYAKTDYGVTLTEAEAQAMRKTFFQQYPGLVKWHENMRAFVREHGYVRARHGAKRHLPNIFSVDEKIQSEAERQAINSPVQRLASDLGLIGATRFDRDCPTKIARVVAFIHDAVILEIKEGYEEEVLSAIRWYMQTPPLKDWFGVEPPLPIVADVSVGTSLGAMKERPDIAAKRPRWARPHLDARAAA